MQNMQFQLMIPGPVTKRLIIVNLAIWLVLQVVVENLMLSTPYVTLYFGLIPKTVMESFFIWQLVTYMFLHAATNPMHILFNMISLWFFGSELEMRWGGKKYLTYYLFTGFGAGLIYLIGIATVGILRGIEPQVYTHPVVGASGAVFGILLAYAILFGDRMIYFFGVFPIKARYFVMIIAGIELISLMSTGFTGAVANLAHIGGLISGFLYLVVWTRIQQRQWRKTSSTRRNLKLVVNKDDEEGGPKYWN